MKKVFLILILYLLTGFIFYLVFQTFSSSASSKIEPADIFWSLLIWPYWTLVAILGLLGFNTLIGR